MKRFTSSPDKRADLAKRCKTHSHEDHDCQAKISCDYCHKDITYTARILCAECVEFDLCLECFSGGVELKGHKYWHNYRVVEDLRFSFLAPDWSANEEQLLLEGLELFGIGNWCDVSNYVSSKDTEECKGHYEMFYLNSPTWPEVDFEDVCDSRVHSSPYKRSKCGSTRKQRRAANRGGSAKRKQEPMPAAVVSLSGYMPRRQEFEVEWDNSCEKRIMDIEFTDTDTEEEFELKMQLLETYNKRLDKRRNVRRMVVEKKLHDQNHQSHLKKSRAAEAEKLHSEMKKYLQVMDPMEYEEMLKGLIRQNELEQRIKELQEYRAAGLTSLKEVSEYKQDLLLRKEKTKKSETKTSATASSSRSPTRSPTRSSSFSQVTVPVVPVAPVLPPSPASLEKPRSPSPDERVTRSRARKQEEKRKEAEEIIIVETYQPKQRRVYNKSNSGVFLHPSDAYIDHNVFAVAVI